MLWRKKSFQIICGEKTHSPQLSRQDAHGRGEHEEELSKLYEIYRHKRVSQGYGKVDQEERVRLGQKVVEKLSKTDHPNDSLYCSPFFEYFSSKNVPREAALWHLTLNNSGVSSLKEFDHQVEVDVDVNDSCLLCELSRITQSHQHSRLREKIRRTGINSYVGNWPFEAGKSGLNEKRSERMRCQSKEIKGQRNRKKKIISEIGF